MLTTVLFFLFAGATLTALVWSGAELMRNQEDPLADRLDELQSQAMVLAQKTIRRKGRGVNRILYLVSLLPGGDDWMRGSERLLNRAGIRRRNALAVYVIFTLIFFLTLTSVMIYLQRHNPASSWLGGLVAAAVLGFMLPKVVL